MTINLSDINPRVSYTVAQGATQTSFAVPFEFFDNDDLNFYVDGTLKTLTTHYTVSGGDGSTGTITTTTGNSVTGISGGSTVIVTRVRLSLSALNSFVISHLLNFHLIIFAEIFSFLSNWVVSQSHVMRLPSKSPIILNVVPTPIPSLISIGITVIPTRS